MTGQGGWPMTCILTPDGAAVLRGHVLPRAPRHGMPAFGQVLEAIVQAWRERRDEVETSAATSPQHLAAGPTQLPASRPTTSTSPCGACPRRVVRPDADAGFGGAPKFPPSMVCEFLLRHAARTGDSEALGWPSGRSRRWRAAASTTSSAAASRATASTTAGTCRTSRRCCTTTRLLLRVYLHWCRQTGSALWPNGSHGRPPIHAHASCGTAEGGFASALDADSDGEEGAFYVWTPAQLARARAADAALRARRVRACATAGTSRQARRRCGSTATPATRRGFDDVRRRLLAARSERTRPARDDKVVAAWNGLAIAGAGRGWRAPGRAGPVDAAAAAAGCSSTCTSMRRATAAGLARRRRRLAGRRARGLRLRRRRFPRAVRARPAKHAGSSTPRSLSCRSSTRFRRRRRRLLRHRGRRRDPAQTTAGPGRQRLTLGRP